MAMDYSGGLLGQLGGILGITDPDKGKRSMGAMASGQEDANRQLDADTAAQLGMLEQAGVGRSLGQNLDAYDTSMGTAQDMTQRAGGIALGQENAGSASDVFGNLNPMMDEMLSRTKQQMQGTAGDALQSSATSRGTAQAVAGKAGDLWQQAFQNTMNRAQNNLNVANNYGQAAGQTANLAGIPGISVPCGLADDGLPVGFQVLAPAHRDDLMYEVAAAVEAAAGDISGSCPAKDWKDN